MREKIVKAETCHRAELTDYISYYVADFGEKTLQDASKAEEEKPYNQRNLGALLLLELGKLL